MDRRGSHLLLAVVAVNKECDGGGSSPLITDGGRCAVHPPSLDVVSSQTTPGAVDEPAPGGFSAAMESLANMAGRDPIIRGIEHIRLAQGMTREELADATGYNISTLDNLRSGRISPKYFLVRDCLQAMGYKLQIVKITEE